MRLLGLQPVDVGASLVAVEGPGCSCHLLVAVFGTTGPSCGPSGRAPSAPGLPPGAGQAASAAHLCSGDTFLKAPGEFWHRAGGAPATEASLCEKC